MKHPLANLIEERIQEAIDQGDLSNLPNAGKPLASLEERSDDVLARVMREKGGKPAFVELNGKLQALIQRMSEVSDPLKRRALERQIAEMRTRVALEKERGL